MSRRVVVVTGGGGGIGAAMAEASGGPAPTSSPSTRSSPSTAPSRCPRAEETTAGHIVAAGGSAQASNVSVTDGDALRALFGELAERFGGLDAVVNVAGITRPTGFAAGGESEWRSVVEVHLGG